MTDELEYKIPISYENGVDLEIRIFPGGEHKWKHSYRYRKIKDRTDVLLVNEWKLYLRYLKGIIGEVNLTMHIINPANLGKEYLYGMDVSKGGKMFLEFVYVKEDDVFILDEIIRGAKERLYERKNDPSDGLFKPMDFPFPVPERLEHEFGNYEVLFLQSDGQPGSVIFPKNVLNQLPRMADVR